MQECGTELVELLDKVAGGRHGVVDGGTGLAVLLHLVVGLAFDEVLLLLLLLLLLLYLLFVMEGRVQFIPCVGGVWVGPLMLMVSHGDTDRWEGRQRVCAGRRGLELLLVLLMVLVLDLLLLLLELLLELLLLLLLALAETERRG